MFKHSKFLFDRNAPDHDNEMKISTLKSYKLFHKYKEKHIYFHHILKNK